MQNSLRSLVLVALVLAAAATAVLLFRGTGGDGAPPLPGPVPRAPRDVADDARDGALPAIAPAEVDRSGRAPTPERSGAKTAYEVELAEAWWIEGRVVFPPQTPAGETAVVQARGKRFEHGPQHSAPVGPDGRFRVAVAPETKKAVLYLEAAHLYLESGTAVRRADVDPVVLEPRLGWRVLGRAVPPDADPETARQLVGQSLTLWRDDDALTTGVRTATIGEDLTFVLPALTTDFPWALSCEPEELVPEEVEGLTAEPGADREVLLAFVRGARVSGRVARADGTPAPSVTVSASSESSFDWLGEREVETDGEGHFVLAGIPPGEVTVEAQVDGAAPATWGPQTLRDGDVVDGITLVLGAGLRLSGTVRFPDGAPAAKAEVTVGTHAADWTSPDPIATTTDAQGRFVVAGLTSERLDVHAEAKRRDDAGEIEVWMAEALDVAGGQDLALSLGRGLACAGRVLDDLGRPIETFVVLARQSRRGLPDLERRRSVDGAADGAFALAGLAPGTWNLEAEVRGVRSRPVAVRLPGTEPVVLTLARPAALAGVVTDAAGEAVRRARVEVQRTSGDLFDSGPTSGATTDDAGAFAFERVPSGSVTLSVAAPGFARRQERIALAPGEQRAGLRIALTSGGRIDGRLRSTGDAVAQRTIDLYADDPWSVVQTSTGEDGSFRFEHLAAGTYTVQCDPTAAELGGTAPDDPAAALQELGLAKRVAIVDGERVSVTLGGGRTGGIRVHGRVLVGETPLEDATILVTRASLGDYFESMAHAESGADGRYEVFVERAGEVELLVHADGLARVRRRVVLADVSSVELDLVLQVGRVTGTVRGADGSPLAAVSVRAWNETGDTTSTWPDSADDTDEEGRYALEGLSPGPWTLRAGGSQRPDFEQPAQAAAYGLAERRGVLVREEDTAEVDFTLAPAGAVRGRVTDRFGTPLARAAVFVRGADGRLAHPSPATRTEDDGTFRVEGLAPGRVALLARTEFEVTREQRTVEVGSGAEPTVELVVEPGTRVRTHVVDGERWPVSAALRVVDGAGRAMPLREADQWSLDPSVGPLPPGEYTLHAECASGRGEARFSVGGEAETTVEVVVE